MAVAVVMVDSTGERMPSRCRNPAARSVSFIRVSTEMAAWITGRAPWIGGDEHIVAIFIGFAIFNFFMNAGPNATTYALPAEVFPSDVRAAGHGFAAGAAKLGAAIGVFFFPILLDEIGQSALLYLMAGLVGVAFVVTWVFRIETAGKSLDEISGRKVSALKMRPSPP